MSLEHIIDKIAGDARAEAEKIVADSRAKAESVREDARREAARLSAEILAEAELQGKIEAGRIVTQARLEKRIELLTAKQDLITEVLRRVFEREDLRRTPLKKKIILKGSQKEEIFNPEKLAEELRPRLENSIAELLKI